MQREGFMKTLKIIQTLSKIGKILSKIIYICCIVGFAGCIVGIIAMIIGGQTVKIGGMSLHSILQTEANVGEGTIWSAIVVGLIFSVGEFFLARMSYRYFENELKIGTPFSEDGAKEMFRLGISAIWIPLATLILAQISQEIFANLMEAEKLDLDGFESVSLGVMFIVMSLICKHGAELSEENKEN